MSKNTGKLRIEEAIISDDALSAYDAIYEAIEVSDGTDYDRITNVINDLSDDVRCDVIVGLVMTLNKFTAEVVDEREM